MVEIETTGWYVLSSNEDKLWSEFKNDHGLNEKTVGRYIYELKTGIEHDQELTTDNWTQIDTNSDPTLEHKKGHWVRVTSLTANQDSLSEESVPLIGTKLGNNIPVTGSTGVGPMAVSMDGQSLTVATVGYNSSVIAKNGYYPLYINEADANAASTEGSSHTHKFDGDSHTYYMPNGLPSGDQYHGTYSETDSSIGVNIKKYNASFSEGGTWIETEYDFLNVDSADWMATDWNESKIGMSENGNNIVTTDERGNLNVFSKNNDSANSTSWTVSFSGSVDESIKAITISNDGSTIAATTVPVHGGNGIVVNTYTLSGGTVSDKLLTQTGTTNVDYDIIDSDTIAMAMNGDASTISLGVSNPSSDTTTIINFSSNETGELTEKGSVNIYHEKQYGEAVTFNGNSLIMLGSQRPQYRTLGQSQKTIAIQEYNDINRKFALAAAAIMPPTVDDIDNQAPAPEETGTAQEAAAQDAVAQDAAAQDAAAAIGSIPSNQPWMR